MKMELRINPTLIEVNEDGSMTVSGYVNKTEQWSELLGRTDKFREKITRGAFERAIGKADEVHFLAEHDNKKILASTRNGSLSLTEDENGLFMSATICPTSWGKDYYQLIKSGILRNMSFGFRAIKDVWKKVDGYFERTIQELELFEVSVVRDPAYSQSTISARGIDVVEDVDIPTEELTIAPVYTFTIRSEEELKALADELFKRLYEQLKTVNEPEPTVETEEEQEQVEEEIETPVDEPSLEETSETEETVVEDEVKDEQVEDQVDEPVVEEPVKSEAEKLRDFINQFKTA